MTRTAIPYHVALPKRLEIARLADRMGRSPREVVGLLLELWNWFDEAGKDGWVAGARLADLPGVIDEADAAFFSTLSQAGWLVETPAPCGLAVPGWDRSLDGFLMKRRQLIGAMRFAGEMRPGATA